MSKYTPEETEWFDKLKQVAISRFEFTKGSVQTFDQDAWLIYFHDGLDPEQALHHEMTTP